MTANPVDLAIEAAMAEHEELAPDSEPETEPVEDEEQLETAPSDELEVEESEEGDFEELLEDQEPTDDEELDEEDLDDELDDEDDEEVLEEESDELEEQPEDERVDWDQTVSVKVQGEEFEVTLEELRDGYQRQEDYTRSKQEVAQEKRQVQQVYQQMKNWYEERAADPGMWMREIADMTDSPHETVAEALRRSDDPNSELVLTVKTLAEQGDLSEELVEAMGLQDIYNTVHRDDRVSRLEKRLEQQEQAQQAQATQQQILQEYERQWHSIKSQEDLDFDNPEEELQAKVELMKFARDEQITNLETAWAAKSYRQQRNETQKQAKRQKATKSRQRAASRKRKKKSAAMSKKPTGGPQPPAPRTSDPNDLEKIIDEVATERGIPL